MPNTSNMRNSINMPKTSILNDIGLEKIIENKEYNEEYSEKENFLDKMNTMLQKNNLKLDMRFNKEGISSKEENTKNKEEIKFKDEKYVESTKEKEIPKKKEKENADVITKKISSKNNIKEDNNKDAEEEVSSKKTGKNYNIVSYEKNIFGDRLKNLNNFFIQKEKQQERYKSETGRGKSDVVLGPLENHHKSERISLMFRQKSSEELRDNKVFQKAYNNLDQIIMNNIINTTRELEIEREKEFNENYERNMKYFSNSDMTLSQICPIDQTFDKNISPRERQLTEKKLRKPSGKSETFTIETNTYQRRNTDKYEELPKQNDNDQNASKSIKIADRILKNINSDILITDIVKPFSIKLKQVELLQTNFSLDPKKEILSNLKIKMQLFCGSKAFSKPKYIFYNAKLNEKYLYLNKQVYFDIKYKDIPNFASIIFKVKVLCPTIEDLSRSKYKTMYWVNFRLFDHSRSFKTGNHKISTWEAFYFDQLLSTKTKKKNDKHEKEQEQPQFWKYNFSDNSYFCWNENFQKEATHITFEMESFQSRVVYPPKNETKRNSRRNSNMNFMISNLDLVNITNILNYSPFKELNSYDKDVLINNQFSLTQIESAIPKLLSCMEYTSSSEKKNLDKLLNLCKPLPLIEALKLLTGDFLNESIRRYAVYSLEIASLNDIQEHLIQIVQALKYEMFHDSHLARFLLKLAIKNPLNLGHSLFWNLRSEMFNPNVQQRFGLYLEVFLTKIGPDLRKVFKDEAWLIERLLEVADIPHDPNFKKNKFLVRQLYLEALDNINKDFKGREISTPLNYKMKVKRLISDKCKIMTSKKKPMWLVFKNAEESAKNVLVMFKKGDDLRQDILTIQLFKVMNNMWFERGLKLKMSNYTVISTGYFQGILEIVTDSETLASIHKNYGGTLAPFSSKPLKQWLDKNARLREEDYSNYFKLSCVAYCLATFVLGIGDRHNDNIMVKKNGELFHIDFGHFLGHFKYKFGIKRENAPFVFTDEFCNVLGGSNSESMKEFKKICKRGYQILRERSDILVTLLKMMICTDIPELTQKSIRTLEDSLCLNASNNDEADNHLMLKLDEAINSLMTKINFVIHNIANK